MPNPGAASEVWRGRAAKLLVFEASAIHHENIDTNDFTKPIGALPKSIIPVILSVALAGC